MPPFGRTPPYLAIVFVVVASVHCWTLWLPFQGDDYWMIARGPWSMSVASAQDASDPPPFMVRLPLWALVSLLIRVLPEPLSPVPFHTLSLLLHASAATLVATSVNRLTRAFDLYFATPGRPSWLPGFVAGLFFGCQAGHDQAFRWVSAWSDMFTVLFGLIALRCLMAARRRGGRCRVGLLLGAGASVALAVMSKSTGVIAVVAVSFALACSLVEDELRGRRLRTLLSETGLVAATGLLGMWGRAAFLGTWTIRHFGNESPDPVSLLMQLPGGLSAVGQSLYPWNRAELFIEERPVLGRAVEAVLGGAVEWPLPSILGWSAVAIGLVPALLLVAARNRRSTRGLTVATFGVTLVVGTGLLLTVPPALLFSGWQDNSIGRTCYGPMVPIGAAVGVAGVVLLRSASTRWFGAAWLLALAAICADGLIHVMRTQLRAAEHQRSLHALVEEISREHAEHREDASDLVVFVEQPRTFAHIQTVWLMIPQAFARPFVSESVDVRTYPTLEALAARWHTEDVVHRSVAVITIEGAPLGPTYGWRRLGPLREGLEESGRLSGGQGVSVFTSTGPIPAHAVNILELSFPADAGAGELQLRKIDGSHESFALGASSGPTRVLSLDRPAVAIFGPPIAQIVWRGDSAPPSSIRILTRASRLEAVEIPSAIEVRPEEEQHLAPWTFTFELPEKNEIALGATVTLRLVLDFYWLATQAVARADCDPAEGSFTVTTETVELFGSPVPWGLFARAMLDRAQAAGFTQLTCNVRAELLDADGFRVARSEQLTVRYRLPRAN